MPEQMFHFGKYKATPLNKVPDSYLEWVVHNITDSRSVTAAQAELDSRGKTIIATGDKSEGASPTGSLFSVTQSVPKIPKGKYKNQQLTDLDDATIHALWAAWNGIPKLKSHEFFGCIVKEKQQRNRSPQPSKANRSVKKPVQKVNDFAATHYQWKMPGGQLEWIPNYIDMAGRENELAPF